MKQADGIDDIEQSQESTEAPAIVSSADIQKVHATANILIEQLKQVSDGDMVGEIVVNALKLLRDQTNRGDIKLINKSLKELRYALKIFAPYRDVRKVSIFGSARTPEVHPDYAAAAEFGKLMAEAGWMVITGAGAGIMAAGHGGGGAEKSFGLAIRLPFEQKTNDFIANDPKLITFKYFFTRKLMFLRSSHAVALFPGGFGTMDEGFEVLTLVQTGKSAPIPIVFVDAPGGEYWKQWEHYVNTQLLVRGLISEHDHRLYLITDDMQAAIREIRHFYSNYHSVRYTRDDIVMRLHRAPTEKQRQQIAAEFLDIAKIGATEADFRVTTALPVEKDEPTLSALPRLVFPFNRRDHGRLRILIDHLNDLPL